MPRALWKHGEWVDVTDGLEQECCDCGLVHKWEYVVTASGKILATVERVDKPKRKRK